MPRTLKLAIPTRPGICQGELPRLLVFWEEQFSLSRWIWWWIKKHQNHINISSTGIPPSKWSCEHLKYFIESKSGPFSSKSYKKNLFLSNTYLKEMLDCDIIVLWKKNTLKMLLVNENGKYLSSGKIATKWDTPESFTFIITGTWISPDFRRDRMDEDQILNNTELNISEQGSAGAI